MSKRSLALLLALVMVLASLLSACGNKTTESNTPAASTPSTSNTPAASTPSNSGTKTETKTEDRHYAVDADTVVLGVADETPSLTPREHNAVEGSRMNNLTYNELISLDNDLAPQCSLAESYTVEEGADGVTDYVDIYFK